MERSLLSAHKHENVTMYQTHRGAGAHTNGGITRFFFFLFKEAATLFCQARHNQSYVNTQ